MPLPPALTPEQRHAALQKAAEARRQRAEVKAKLKQGSLGLEDLFDQGTRDDALAKLKVVSVLESLPGVGKVQARRIMAELDISESRRLRGLGRNQREGSALPPEDRPRGLIWQFSSSSSARRGSARAPSSASCWNRTRRSGSRSRRRRVRRGPGEVDGVRVPLRQPRGVRGPARGRRAPRGVRGLRPLVRHAARARGGASGRGAGRAARDRRPGRAGGPGGLSRRGAARVRQAAVTRRAAPAPGRAGRGRRGRDRASTRRRRQPRRPHAGEFDDVVVNDDVDAAVDEVAGSLRVPPTAQ